jgi:multidrug efflux pump subunit AcrB
MVLMESLAAKLPAGIGYDWTGMSYQERLSGNQAPALYAISLIVVFLCLAALYELVHPILRDAGCAAGCHRCSSRSVAAIEQ